ncbi:hypothetical protein OOK58_55350 [Streptomyces sp. NBC_01728]|nr:MULTISPECIES: hypothetical protein [unclassified Streptomyces]MCX4460457.1 hypothetical protein [Streptomyces sp. NBC_01719]MCX4500213.1 hypothetical protein [Streptomyces sp. NBC_01728]
MPNCVGDDHQAQRHVDQEDGTPAPSEQIRPDQDTADQLAGDGGQSDGDAEEREGALAPCPLEGGLDDGEDLREEQGGGEALDTSEGDQRSHAGCAAAGERGGGEQSQTGQEHRLWPTMSPSRPPVTRKSPYTRM